MNGVSARERLGRSVVAEPGATVQVLDPPDTEQLHGPDGLLAQQLTRALDPALATGHQPVQVGAADQDSAAPIATAAITSAPFRTPPST